MLIKASRKQCHVSIGLILSLSKKIQPASNKSKSLYQFGCAAWYPRKALVFATKWHSVIFWNTFRGRHESAITSCVGEGLRLHACWCQLYGNCHLQRVGDRTLSNATSVLVWSFLSKKIQPASNKSKSLYQFGCAAWYPRKALVFATKWHSVIFWNMFRAGMRVQSQAALEKVLGYMHVGVSCTATASYKELVTGLYHHLWPQRFSLYLLQKEERWSLLNQLSRWIRKCTRGRTSMAGIAGIANPFCCDIPMAHEAEGGWGPSHEPQSWPSGPRKKPIEWKSHHQMALRIQNWSLNVECNILKYVHGRHESAITSCDRKH